VEGERPFDLDGRLILIRPSFVARYPKQSRGPQHAVAKPFRPVMPACFFRRAMSGRIRRPGHVRQRRLRLPRADGTRVVFDAWVSTSRRGQRITRSRKGFVTPDAAWAWIDEQRLFASPGTFGRLMADWLEAVRPHLRPTTLDGYERHVRLHLSPVAGMRIDQLGSSDLTRRYAELVSAGLSPTTARSVHATARACLGWAVDQDPPLIPRNVALKARPPRKQRPDIMAWEPEEIRRIIEAAQDVMRPLVVLVAHTGVRRGEALGLEWGDLDADVGKVQIRRALMPGRGGPYLSPPKTERSVRAIEVPPAVVAALLEWRRVQASLRLASGTRPGALGDLMFTREDGSSPLSPSVVSHRFATIVRRAGVRTGRLHDMRHSWATIALAANVPVLVVSQTLGHASAATTLTVYAHRVPGGSRQATDAVATALE
jgi:integrase